MASLNPFELLGEDDAEDPMLLLAAQEKAAALALAAAPPKKAPISAQPPAKDAAKLQSKAPRPALPLRESTRNEVQRGRRGGARGRGGSGFNREFVDRGTSFGSDGFDSYKPSEDGEGGKASSERQFNGGPRGGGGFRGGRRGGFSNGEVADGERPRRAFDRRSGTGRGNEMKRGGSGRANWGASVDEIVPVPGTEEPAAEEVKNVESEKQVGEDDAVDANKDKESSPTEEEEKKEPEEKEMTLEEYERLLEEKRKALLPLKSEERKVELDKELKSMQLLSNKKNDDDIFIKLGSDKDKRKEAAEKAKKSLSINEFLKPVDGENYRSGGRGRGRGRGREGYRGNNMNMNMNMPAPAIEDALQFPALLAK